MITLPGVARRPACGGDGGVLLAPLEVLQPTDVERQRGYPQEHREENYGDNGDDRAAIFTQASQPANRLFAQGSLLNYWRLSVMFRWYFLK